MTLNRLTCRRCQLQNANHDHVELIRWYLDDAPVANQISSILLQLQAKRVLFNPDIDLAVHDVGHFACHTRRVDSVDVLGELFPQRLVLLRIGDVLSIE